MKVDDEYYGMDIPHTRQAGDIHKWAIAGKQKMVEYVCGQEIVKHTSRMSPRQVLPIRPTSGG